MREVVVNGRRTQVGAVVGDIKPEIQLSPADIQSFGVSTVTELLQELAPETRSDRGRGGSSPVILLNGRRISSFNEIQNIPTEAILRVDILPEEVSLKYGYTADQRVVNIVLRRRFRAITGEMKGGGPTEGGQVQGQAEGDLLRIRGDNRVNLDLKYQGNSDLTEAARGINATSGAPYSNAGNVTSTLSGASIDPNLDALAGRPVTIAGVPASAMAGPTPLSAWLAGANTPTTTNVGDDRTLSPASQTLTANGVWAHSVLGGIGLTVNGTLSTNQSTGLQGLPGVGLTVPNGDPFSPFSQPVVLDRYVSGYGPLTQVANGWSGHFGATANKDAHGWRFSLTGAYDHSDSLTVSEVGVSTTSAQALLNSLSPTFNPFAALTPGQFPLLADAKARALSDTANAQFLGNGPLAKLPAGDLYASIKFGDTIGLFNSRTDRNGLALAGSLSRNDFNAQGNIDLPVLKRAFKGWGALGDLSLNANLAVDQLSDFGTLTTIGYGLNWTPIKGVNLIVSHTHDHQAPTVQQLGNPVTVTPGVRVLDYVSGQTVQVTTISGANPLLKADSRDVLKVGLTLKPWSAREFTATANYIHSDIRNAIVTPPGSATPQIEADFPNAYIRNAAGQLVEVNQTPVNLTDQSRDELRWGFNFAMPVGPPPPAPPPGLFPRPERGAGGADRGGDRGGAAGGRGGGGGGFGAFRAAQQGRFQVALYHTVFFSDRVLATPTSPVLDLLNGGAIGGSGGQVRHEIEGQLGYTKNGLGLRFSLDWKSATKVDGGVLADDLSFSQIGTLNMRLWDNFGAQPALVKKYHWLRGARLTLEVNNVFDTRQTVHDGNGSTPVAYLPGYINPAGRVVELSLRKLFF